MSPTPPAGWSRRRQRNAAALPATARSKRSSVSSSAIVPSFTRNRCDDERAAGCVSFLTFSTCVPGPGVQWGRLSCTRKIAPGTDTTPLPPKLQWSRGYAADAPAGVTGGAVWTGARTDVDCRAARPTGPAGAGARRLRPRGPGRPQRPVRRRCRRGRPCRPSDGGASPPSIRLLYLPIYLLTTNCEGLFTAARRKHRRWAGQAPDRAFGSRVGSCTSNARSSRPSVCLCSVSPRTSTAP